MKEGWKIKKLGEIGTFQRGGGFLKSDYVDEGFPCIHYGQIHTRFGVKAFNHFTCIPKQLALSKSKIAHDGDIVIAITSEDVEGSCKCTAWMGGYDVAVGGHAAIFKHSLNPAFVAYYFRGAYFQTAKKVFAHGSKVVEIKPNDIASINIAYPPIAEQEKIVAELDCLSEIIEKKKQQLKKYDDLAQSIFYEMFGDPVENDKGWENKKFKDCYKLTSGKSLTAKKIIEGNYPVYGGNGIVGYHYDYNLDGDNIIIGRVGALCGNVRNIIGKAFITDNAFILTKLEEGLNVFILYLLKVHNLRQYARDALQPVVSNTGFQNIDIIIPPLSLQQEFASKIEAIEKQKALIKKSIEEVETLFNSRMEYYFN